MSNDLISREALKKAIKNDGYSHYFEIFDIIDNAPTIEPICPYLSDYEVKQSCLNSPCERQQGEWIKVREDRMSIDMSGEIVTGYKCSICGRYIVTLPSKLADYPFCHCGAEMQKGGAEE